MNTKKNIIKSSVMRNVQFIIIVLMSLFMTPYIIHALGDRLYGYWSLVGTLIGYYGLLDFGLSSAVERYTSKVMGQKNFNSMSTTASTSIFLFSIFGVVSFAMTLLIIYLSPLFLNNRDELILIRRLILILGTTISISFPFKVYSGIIASFLRYDYLSIIYIFRSFLSNILIYYYLGEGYGILMMSVVSAVMSLLEISIIYYICTTKFPNVKIDILKYDQNLIRHLFSYSSKTFIIKVADILRFRIDSVVIAIYLDVSLVTYYVIGTKLVDYFAAIMLNTIGIFIPFFSKYDGMGERTLLRKRFLEISRIATILSVFIGSSVLIYGKVFIQRWMGPNFEISYYICVILCVPSILALTQAPGIQLLYGISKHKYYAILNIIEGISNVMFSIILVKYYGIYGVALGTAIEMIIFKSFVQPIIICRSINISYFEYFVKTILYTGIKSLAILVLIYSIVHSYIIPNYINIFTIAILQTIMFVPLAYMLLLNEDLRTLLFSMINKKQI